MPWIMELKTGTDKWAAIGPSGGKRYEYATEDEARRMLGICYPDQLREERLGGAQRVRVREAPVKYRIEFHARETGALGLGEDHLEEVEALNRDAAVLKLYDKYEHISVGKIEEV